MSIIFRKGLEANRPLTLRQGEAIYTTDTHHLYIGSGSCGRELEFGELTASAIHASTITVTTPIQGTASWAETASFLIGSIASASYTTFSETASFLLGSIASASYSNYGATASYLSSSGQNVILGDAIITDSASGAWAGNQSFTGSGLFIQRSGVSARSTVFSAGSVLNGNGSYTIAAAGGTLGSIVPTQQGHFGSWQFQTYDGSTWSTSARMLMQTSEDHSAGSRATDILLQSTPSGSATPQTRLKVNGTGVQVTGSFGVNGSIGLNGSAILAKKYVTIDTASYSTGLSLNMADSTSAYVKVSLHGAWIGAGAAVFLGEYFIQKDSATAYMQPGVIISQVNNNSSGDILTKIIDPGVGTGNANVDIQFIASSSVMPAGNFLMVYEVRGQFTSVT